MTYALGQRSLDRLKGVHPDLQKVVRRAIELTPFDFTITEGLRTLERQKTLLAAGASQTLKSRHITGHAIDFAALVGGEVRWDWPLYGKIAEAFKAASAELGVPIIWGGDWKTLRDGPHVELDRKRYP
jgi:peptidoglycan L-alanyl-D-glutamate endopeptidase CwlK